jgi:hypothetical protein
MTWLRMIKGFGLENVPRKTRDSTIISSISMELRFPIREAYIFMAQAGGEAELKFPRKIRIFMH